MFNFVTTLLACVRQPSATSAVKTGREATSTSTSLVKRAWTWVISPSSSPVIAKSPRSSSPTSLRPTSPRALPPVFSHLNTLSVESIRLDEIKDEPPAPRFGGPIRSASRSKLLRAQASDQTAQRVQRMVRDLQEKCRQASASWEAESAPSLGPTYLPDPSGSGAIFSI
ncbi:hypothetical protein RQP46_002311 [Phenoliferia psychrophenolica]